MSQMGAGGENHNPLPILTNGKFDNRLEIDMTQLLMKPKRSKVRSPRNSANSTRRAAEEILRETAFVLQMTQRVKEAILADRSVVNEPQH